MSDIPLRITSATLVLVGAAMYWFSSFGQYSGPAELLRAAFVLSVVVAFGSLLSTARPALWLTAGFALAMAVLLLILAIVDRSDLLVAAALAYGGVATIGAYRLGLRRSG